MTLARSFRSWLLLPVSFLFLAPAASAVTLDWVIVDDPGNAADITTLGAVAYVYWISKFEITNSQYAEFLNAVAETDTFGLYHASMGIAMDLGGITRSGSSGSYTYDPVAGRENMPVNWVPFLNSVRFANWLHNGQPMGAQSNATTEDGAYTIIGGADPFNFLMRNVGAEIFVTSEDEWYKAAYYDVASMSYFAYPAGSNVETTCASPAATANTANCNSAVFDTTDVRSYAGAASPNGTFDQGGNVWEWNERTNGTNNRFVRGGAYNRFPNTLGALTGFGSAIFAAEQGFSHTGFRVATNVPEPASLLLQMTAMLTLLVLRRRQA